VCATIAAFVAVAAGYGAKPSRVERAELALAKSETGSSEAALAYRQLKAALHKQQEQMKLLNKAELAKTHKLAVQEAHHLSKLDEEEAEDADDSADDAATDDAASDDAAADDAPVEDDEAATESKVPDPEEAKKKAAEVADKAKDALAKSQADLMKAVDDLLPGGDLFHAFSWHLDICVYILTMYGVYYVWKTELWTYFLPRMKFNMVQEPELTPRTLARKNRVSSNCRMVAAFKLGGSQQGRTWYNWGGKHFGLESQSARKTANLSSLRPEARHGLSCWK
jgi:hypothetical protein